MRIIIGSARIVKSDIQERYIQEPTYIIIIIITKLVRGL